MTRSEAEQRARWLQENDPARETHRGKLTPTVEAKPRPSPADDPRTGNERRVPGLPGGLG